jgi:hypothetical protein
MIEEYVLPLPVPYLDELSIHRFLMKRATVLEDFCQIDGLSSTEHT